MNPVYIRMAIYFIAPLLGALPGFTYMPDAAQIVIDLEGAAVGLAGSAIVTAGVFKIWGKK